MADRKAASLYAVTGRRSTGVTRASSGRPRHAANAMLPILVLVGRPNVGKSTLFNRLTSSRAALVADFPGLTRDRHYGRGSIGDRRFIVVDTGGFEPVAKSGILHEMAKQTRAAIAEADAVVFLVDGRAGLTEQDRTIAPPLAPVRTPGVPRRSTRSKACAPDAPPPSSTSSAWASRYRDFGGARRERRCADRARAGSLPCGRG